MGCLTCDIMWPPNKIAIGHTIEWGGWTYSPKQMGSQRELSFPSTGDSSKLRYQRHYIYLSPLYPYEMVVIRGKSAVNSLWPFNIAMINHDTSTLWIGNSFIDSHCRSIWIRDMAVNALHQPVDRPEMTPAWPTHVHSYLCNRYNIP